MPIVIECNYTPEDYVRSQYLHERSRLGIYVCLAGLLAAVVMFVGISEWVVRRERLSEPSPLARFLFYPNLALLGVLLFYFSVYIPRRARRLFSQQKDLQSKTRFSLDDSGIAIESETGHWQVPWDHIRKWQENRHLFLFYKNDALFYMLPKHCIFDAMTVEAVHQLAAAHSKHVR